MKYLLLIILASFMTACAQNNEVHYDPTTTTGTQSATKAWSVNEFPLTIYVPTELYAYKNGIEGAAQTWEDAMGRPVFNFVFTDNTKPNTQWAGPLDSLYDNYFGLFKEFTWNYTNIDSGVLAFTGTLTQDGRIQHADILFNFKNYTFGDVVTTPSQTLIDYQSVLTHELGHFLGLNHIDVATDSVSIMNPTLTKGRAKRTLSQDDITRIRTLYGL